MIESFEIDDIIFEVMKFYDAIYEETSGHAQNVKPSGEVGFSG